MKKLEFKTTIDASPEKVWDTMLNLETYKEWTNVSWPGSRFEGNWKQGENLRFLGAGEGGTLANVTDFKPHEFVSAKHIAVINRDGSEDRDSDMAKGWIGTTESYTLKERNGKTELTVDMNVKSGWEKMFSDGWPNALAKLKEICEN